MEEIEKGEREREREGISSIHPSFSQDDRSDRCCCCISSLHLHVSSPFALNNYFHSLFIVCLATELAGNHSFRYYEKSRHYWSNKKIPGPPSQFLTGNLKELWYTETPRVLVMRDWTKKYGKVSTFIPPFHLSRTDAKGRVMDVLPLGVWNARGSKEGSCRLGSRYAQ